MKAAETEQMVILSSISTTSPMPDPTNVIVTVSKNLSVVGSMTQPEPQQPQSQSNNRSLIIGIVVGGVVVALIVIAGVIAFIVSRNRRESKENNHHDQSNDQDQSLQMVENQYGPIPERQLYDDVEDVRDSNANT